MSNRNTARTHAVWAANDRDEARLNELRAQSTHNSFERIELDRLEAEAAKRSSGDGHARNRSKQAAKRYRGVS